MNQALLDHHRPERISTEHLRQTRIDERTPDVKRGNGITDGIPKAIKTRARKLVRASGEDYTEEDVEEKERELYQKYLANKEKAKKRGEKRLKKQGVKEQEAVRIPVLPEGSPEIDLPRYYAVEKVKKVKYRKKNGQEVVKEEKQYKLVNPLTKQRNIAQRKGVKPVTLKRKDVDEVTAENTVIRTIPLAQFVPKDQQKAYNYNRKRIKLDDRGVPPADRPDKSAFDVKERGRPELLPKNIYHHQNKGTSKLNEKLGKLRNPRQPEETKEETRQEEEKEDEPARPEPKKRGRPKKYQTPEEAKKAKFANTVVSNKRRRGEKRDEKKEGEEREAMGAEDRPAPAPPKKMNKQGLIEYYQKILAIHKVADKKRSGSDMSDKIKDLLYSVTFKLEELGYETEQWGDGEIKGIPDIPLTRQIQDEFKIDIRDVPVLKENLGIGNKKDFKTSPEKWFKEQSAILRKMGVTVFDIGRFVKMSKNGPTLYYKSKGSGIMDTLNAGANYIVDKGKQAVGAVVDKGKQIGNTFSQIITGSTDYSPSVRKILQDEGHNLIHKIVVGRTPVQQAITMALNAVSQGQFQSNQDRLNYDKLFHLFSEITLENGHQVRVEKNEVITMTMGHKQDADTERQEVPMTNAVIFRDLLEKAKTKMGAKFFAYDSANNNCQDFIMALLQGSGLGTQENFEFIKQNTKQLFEKIPRTRALAKQITNLGQRINIAMSGGKISVNTIMPKFAKGSQEARDHMARIRGMRGCGTGKDLGKNLGSNLGRLADSGTDKLISMMGTGTGKELGSNLAGNLGRLADSGTDKLINMMGTGTHIHHHHYHPASYGGTVGYGHHHSAEYGSHSGGNVGYSNSGQFGDRGFAEDLIGKLGIKMPTNAKEAVQQAQILQGLTPAGIAVSQVKKMMGRGGPKGLASFNKWTKAIGDFLAPVAKPILQAGTQQAVNNINAYGNANADKADPMGALFGRGMEKGSQAMKDKMAKLRAMRR